MTDVTADSRPSVVPAAGTWQAPSPELAQHIAGLTPESRAAQADYLRDRYPNDRGAIDQAYGITPAPALDQAAQLDVMFQRGDAAGSDIDLSGGNHFLQSVGHDPADAATFVADLKANLATLQLPAGIAGAIGDEMIRAAHASQGEGGAERMNARWQSQIRPQIETAARLPDGSRPSWDQIRDGFRKVFDRLPQEFRNEVLRSGALNSAAVVLHLFNAGQRLMAQEKMRGAAA